MADAVHALMGMYREDTGYEQAGLRSLPLPLRACLISSCILPLLPLALGLAETAAWALRHWQVCLPVALFGSVSSIAFLCLGWKNWEQDAVAPAWHLCSRHKYSSPRVWSEQAELRSREAKGPWAFTQCRRIGRALRRRCGCCCSQRSQGR